MSIYAGTNGYLDGIAADRVPEWERSFYQYMATNYPEIGNAINRENVLSDTTEDGLKLAIEEFNKQFA